MDDQRFGPGDQLLYRALHQRVLVVVTHWGPEKGGLWKAFIGVVPGQTHVDEAQSVLDFGSGVDEALARHLFPSLKGREYAR